MKRSIASKFNSIHYCICLILWSRLIFNTIYSIELQREYIPIVIIQIRVIEYSIRDYLKALGCEIHFALFFSCTTLINIIKHWLYSKNILLVVFITKIIIILCVFKFIYSIIFQIFTIFTGHIFQLFFEFVK